MAKVNFQHKGGRVERMDARFAKVLVGLGRGQYLAKVMNPVAATESERMPKQRLAMEETCELSAKARRGRPRKIKEK